MTPPSPSRSRPPILDHHCACLAVSVFPGLSIHLPRVASRVTLAVRAEARDVTFLSISLGHLIGRALVLRAHWFLVLLRRAYVRSFRRLPNLCYISTSHFPSRLGDRRQADASTAAHN